jgi:choice-of-anchor A domain-containing protein
LRLESSRLKYQTPNNTILIQGSDIVINLKPGANVLTFLKPADLNNAKRIIISGDASSTAVINIPGDQYILDGQDVIISPVIRVSNITWNFHETSFLQITHTHNGKLGMPGIVMAPNALVVFNEALITGALYAGEIVTSMTDSTLNAGQVNIEPNPAPTPAPPAPAPKPN